MEIGKQDEKPQTGIMLSSMNSMVPKDYTEAKLMAVDLSKSEIIPKDYQGKPANCLIAIMMGAEVGLRPVQALQGIMVVNGRPSIWGDAAVGLILASGLQEYARDEWDPKTGTATFITKRKGQPEIRRTFSLDDAAKAGLANKPGPWQGYKPRMCYNRARAFGLRDGYADVLKGLAIYEEVRDIINTTAEPADPQVADPSEAEPTQVAAPNQPAAPETSAAGADQLADGEPAHYEGKVEKVEKIKDAKAPSGYHYRITLDDGISYMTDIKSIADAAQSARESKAPLAVGFAQGIGTREILNLLVPTRV